MNFCLSPCRWCSDILIAEHQHECVCAADFAHSSPYRLIVHEMGLRRASVLHVNWAYMYWVAAQLPRIRPHTPAKSNFIKIYSHSILEHSVAAIFGLLAGCFNISFGYILLKHFFLVLQSSFIMCVWHTCSHLGFHRERWLYTSEWPKTGRTTWCTRLIPIDSDRVEK